MTAAWPVGGGGAAIALGLLLAVSGCGRGAPAAQAPEQRARQLIESGNAAYGAGNYALAARRYAAAAVLEKDDPAAYYGLGMALSRLGRDEEARRAYARARALTQAGARSGGGGR
jgi:Flp pilus assembly protein TadD